MFKIEHLTKDYGDIEALSNVNFSLNEGDSLGLIGTSGSGKSTIARLLMGLDTPSKGHIWYYGKDMARFSKADWKQERLEVQMVFQDPASSLSPRCTIREQLLEPLQIHGKTADLSLALEAVSLSRSFLDRYPHELSGGQRQRVAIARALILRPKCLILDEPISALDVSVGAQIINLLADIKKGLGLTLLFITHDLATLHYLCDRAIVLHKGQLIESGSVERLFTKPKSAYTRDLLAAALL